MDISIEKAAFLKRFEQVTDIELVRALNELLDYALSRQNNQIEIENEESTSSYDLSEEHKMILNERLQSYKNNKGDLISWEDVKKGLKVNDREKVQNQLDTYKQ